MSRNYLQLNIQKTNRKRQPPTFTQSANSFMFNIHSHHYLWKAIKKSLSNHWTRCSNVGIGWFECYGKSTKEAIERMFAFNTRAIQELSDHNRINGREMISNWVHHLNNLSTMDLTKVVHHDGMSSSLLEKYISYKTKRRYCGITKIQSCVPNNILFNFFSVDL